MGSSSDAHGYISKRLSKELVIALSGPVGAGLPVVRAQLERALKERQYTPVHVKLSDLFAQQIAKLKLEAEEPISGSTAFQRIWKLQGMGNKLRSALGEDMAAQLAVKQISVHRASEHPSVKLEEIEPKRVAYIVDQLKHPREVRLLRAIYDDLFYMVGVLSSHDQRTAFLKDLGMTTPEAEKLIDRDRKEADSDGQQLEKTLLHADYFINNSKKNLPGLLSSLHRFLALVHGDPRISPDAEERGMYAAYSAGLRSACLSRQVGAAIVDGAGNIISTGCNDVPKGGGGLYEPGPSDQRCIHKGGLCYNDKHKDKLGLEIAEVLSKEGFKQEQVEKITAAIRKNTRVGALIEFSRAVHAEMDAIVGVARTGAKGIVGSTLYTTVYPCHNCARHIVAAGIASVVFIEPYEKSLAADLHDDAILQELEPKPEYQSYSLVHFRHFEGASPIKFARLFQMGAARKDKQGKAIDQDLASEKKESMYLDDYKVLEYRVIDNLERVEKTLAPTSPVPPPPPAPLTPLAG